MPEEQEYLTVEKLSEIKTELEDLKSVKRKEIADQLEYAKSLGDLSENAEYHEARDTQANLENRIARLEALVKHATIISKHDKDIVSVGSILTVEISGKKKEFTIVGSEEADMSQGKVSVRSPFGSSAIGKKKGESFSVDTPNGKVEYKISSLK
jgi:transcription elongation factor GreA